MATEIRPAKASGFSFTTEDGGDRVFPLLNTEAPTLIATRDVPPARSSASALFDFMARPDGGVGHLSWVWTSQPIAEPRPIIVSITTETKRVGARYAVVVNGKHVGSRRRLGNAQRLAASVGGHIVTAGQIVTQRIPCRVAAMAQTGVGVEVTFDILVEP